MIDNLLTAHPMGWKMGVIGNRDIVKENLFGFMRVKVKAPLTIDTPLLQVRVDKKTICGLGT
jgi:hypothetical protein